MALTKVLYHFPCPDGITAALACHLYHLQKSIQVDFIPHKTFEPIDIDDLKLDHRHTVYLLDYAGPSGFAQSIAHRVSKCVVLDHHKTALEQFNSPAIQLPQNLDVSNIDMNRSGATIALDYFKPGGLSEQNIEFFSHIEDGDLWRWNIPGSREFYAGFRALSLDFDATTNPRIFDQLLALSPSELIKQGSVEIKRQHHMIQEAMKRAFIINIGGEGGGGGGGGGERSRAHSTDHGQCLAVDLVPLSLQDKSITNSDELASLISLRSELGNELAVASRDTFGLRPMAAVVYREPRMDSTSNIVKVSLRSVGGAEIADTTVISKLYGGGGHCNASSFLIDYQHFIDDWKVT